MPIRFTTPSLGGRSDAYLDRHAWSLGVAYRRLTADEWFSGRDHRDDLAPSGRPLQYEINSLAFTAAFGLTDRIAATLNVPWSRGSMTRAFPDSQWHTIRSSGLGEVNLVTTGWIWNPKREPRGNIALGAGVKTPTGHFRAEDKFWNANGTVTRLPVDQSIQLGDGGWGIILQSEAFRQIASRAAVYAWGSYTANPREMTDVVRAPGSTLRYGVPDVYTVRAGVTGSVWRVESIEPRVHRWCAGHGDEQSVSRGSGAHSRRDGGGRDVTSVGSTALSF